MPQRSVATNFTFEQQRQEINLLAGDFWTQKGIVDTAASTYLKHDGSNAFTGGTLNVPNAFTISANSGSGTLTISGNLDVTGTTTTVSTANLEVTDKNILIAKGSSSDAQADGAGITIDSATDITFNFVDAQDALVSSIGLEGTTFLKAPYGQFTGSGTATGGQGVEINAPDANTGQIISYDRANTAYKELRVKGSSVGVYTGTTNALVGSFSSTGLTMESGKTITGVIATAGQPNITSVGTLTVLAVDGDVTVSRTGLAVNKFESTDNHSRLRILSANTSYAQLEFGDQADVDAGEIRYSNTSDSTDYMAFHVGNNVEHMRLTQDGVLGLKGILRTQAYDTAGGVGGYNANGLIIGNAYDAGKTTSITDDRNAIIWQERGLDLDFATQDTFRMKLTYDGKLLLGTTSSNTSDCLTIMDPGNAFMSLRSDAHADLVAQHLDFIVGTGNRASGNMVGAIRAQVPDNTTAGGTLKGELSFWTNSGDNIGEKMTIKSDGLVGIGVTDPAVAGGYGGMEIGGSDNTGLRLSVTSNGGWAFHDFEINGTQTYVAGVKGGTDTYATASSYRICSGPSFDTNQLLVVNADGSVLTPSQVGFAARMTTNQVHPGNNSFNSGSSWQMLFDAEVWDIGGNFNVSNYTFTAPIAGRYLCCYTVQIETISNWLWMYMYPVVTGTGGTSNTAATTAAGVVFSDMAGTGVTGSTTTTAAYQTISNTIVMNLTAGQQVRMGTRGQITADIKSGAETQWTMQLLG